MGACCCCCASKQADITNSSPFYHYPRVSEEREPLSSHLGASSAVSPGFLVDTNLDTSIPDTYRPPPSPIPYETFSGRPQTHPGNQESSGGKTEAAVQIINPEPVGKTNEGSSLVTTEKDSKEPDDTVKSGIELAASKEFEDDIEKSGELKKSSKPIVSAIAEEEDGCPICLEEYDAENPKIKTKCGHHFHLACILEWMERSDTCAVCSQDMVFDASFDVAVVVLASVWVILFLICYCLLLLEFGKHRKETSDKEELKQKRRG